MLKPLPSLTRTACFLEEGALAINYYFFTFKILDPFFFYYYLLCHTIKNHNIKNVFGVQMSKHHEKHTEKNSKAKDELEKETVSNGSSAEKNDSKADCGCDPLKENPHCTKETAVDSDGKCGEKIKKDEEASNRLKRIEELETACKDWQEQYLRKAADFENYRKRMIREKQEAIDYANANLLSDLIQILDDFDRAIEAGQNQNGDSVNNAFAEGVIMIKKQMESLLSSKYGLNYYPSKGLPFDPNLYEAVSMIQSPDVKEAVVGEELQKGYKLKERVIRHSKVMVLMPAEKQAQDKAEETADTQSEKL